MMAKVYLSEMRKLCRKSGKVKFNTHEQALIRAGEVMTMANVNRKHGDRPVEMAAYRCKFCNHFHMTRRK